MRTYWIAAVSTVLVCGCACEPTPYQRAIPRSGKGYSEKRISEDTFYIRYAATTCTPGRVLSKYLCRRAAEVTLQYGYRYFTVLRRPSHPIGLDTYTVGGHEEPPRTVVVQAETPGTLFMPIQCFKDRPESSDARLIDARDYLAGE